MNDAAEDRRTIQKMMQAMAPELPSSDDTLDEPMRWHGPAISFRKWHDLQDDAMKARVRVVFPSLKVGL